MANLVEDLKMLVRTRHALVTMQTMEESYAARLIRETGREMGLTVMEWSISEGLKRTVPTSGENIKDSQTLLAALTYMRSNDAMNIYILKDSLKHLADARTERMFREVAIEFARDSRTVFLLDTGGKLPDCLHLLAVPFDLALPGEEEIKAIIRHTYQHVSALSDAYVDMNKDEFSRFVSTLKGLTRMEISQVVSEAVLGYGKLGVEDVTRAVELKRRRLRQTGVLDYIPPPETTPSIGGMKNLRYWLEKRSKAYSQQAIEFGLESPKGILMLGVQGCGKSLMARYVAAKWKMPLLRMDVGALYDKFVGETERHLRQAFGTASAMAPCVLWMDEIEKAFASAGTGTAGAASDGGLSQRLFGQLLTWMQEHPEPVFIVATANDVTALPPELLRKGRFDEIFFVDLPGIDARKKIFEIHLSKRKRDPAAYDLDALCIAADGFSGAEIEQAIVSAMYAAFNDDQKLDTEDILEEISNTSPLSVVMAEKVQKLRDWAQNRCVRAD